jgi:hypothetical protein
MTGYYVIAMVDGNSIYNMHNKVYVSESKARDALKTLQKNNYTKNFKGYEVFGIKDLTEVKKCGNY